MYFDFVFFCVRLLSGDVRKTPQFRSARRRATIGLTDLGNNLDLGDVLGTAGSAHVIRVDALVELGGIGRAAFVLGQVRTHALTVLHPSHL